MTKRSVTQEYPHVRPELPPRSRGVIALLEENCTSCMLCARECPDWCIYIDSHKETIPATTEGGRDRTRNVLDRFAIDYSLCMYCGICIEVCPFDALFWSPEFEYAEGDIVDLTHEKDRLREWMPSVPAPPADVLNAEPAKEVSGGSRVERRERPPRPEHPARPVREAAADATAPTVADDLPAEAIAQVPPDQQQAAEADAGTDAAEGPPT
jgi:NADH-quinone oxidoreductase subunit I